MTKFKVGEEAVSEPSNTNVEHIYTHSKYLGIGISPCQSSCISNAADEHIIPEEQVMTKASGWKFLTDVNELQELLTFWNDRAKELEEEKEFYKQETRQTQEILGRVISQYSERWDTVQLTNYPRKRSR